MPSLFIQRGSCDAQRGGGFSLLGAIFFVCMGSISFATDATPRSELPQIVGVRVGFAGYYKTGLWTPVEVALHGGSKPFHGKLSLLTPDGDGIPTRVFTPNDQPCDIPADGETTVRLCCRFGRVHSTLVVELRNDDKVKDKALVQRTFEAAEATDQENAGYYRPGLEFQSLVVTIGPRSIGVEEAGKLSGAESDHRPVAARLADLDHLPTQWYGYEGVDAVVLSTTRPEVYQQLTGKSGQIEALDQWVQMGGRLVLCVGAQAEQVFTPNSLLHRFLPGRFVKMVTLRQTGALESFSGSRQSISLTEHRKTMRAPRLAEIQGTLEAHEADLPVVIRTARGFGQVIVIAADLDQPPLDSWTDRPLLVAKLLDMPIGHGEESEEGTAMMHFGFSDISGQLRSALDRFPGVELAPFWLVAGLIVAYIVLIGPGDYFFHSKLTGRMTWTWLTFPLVVVLVCVGAYVLAHRLKGDRLRFNQTDLVDVDTTSGRLRGASWFNIFSPKTEMFHLSVRPQSLDGTPATDARVRMAWMGLPGSALGGMNPHTAGTAMQWAEPYVFSPSLDVMYDVPIQVWSTKSFTARWHTTIRTMPEAELIDENQLLTGSVTNTLDFPWEQCILAYGGSVYDLGAIAPGESARIDAMSKRSELKTLLTGRKVITVETTGDKYRQVATPYDQSSTDIPYILRTMMFYDAAGGPQYTGLSNAYQNFVDLTQLLKADRAILVVQTANDSKKNRHGAALLRDGQALDETQNIHTTIYRFVFPVKKEKTE